MDDQLVIDSSGAWVRKTAQLIAEKPLLPPEHFGGQPYVADLSLENTNNQHEDTYIFLLD
jgi:hypothetical protein